MKKTGRIVLIIAAFAFAVIPLLSQTTSTKPSFEVVSIKPSPPNLGIRGGGPRGDRFTMSGASLKMLLQIAYGRSNSNGLPNSQLQVIGGPNWIDSDRYDIQAKADCSGGALSREQLQLMMQAMLEDRFQLRAHMETRELPIYNLVVAKDGPRIKASADQTPPPISVAGPQPCGPAPTGPPPFPPPAPGQPGGAFDPASMPRGAMMMMMNPTGLTMQAPAIPITNLVNLLQQFVGRPVVDKTDLKGLYDVKLQFSREGLTLPGPGPGAPGGFGPGLGPGPAPGSAGLGGTSTDSADPIPSLFTAIQDLGLRLESSKGLVEVLVVDSAQKPTEN
jgi:uncharacterized protein (TIGR03435 family)